MHTEVLFSRTDACGEIILNRPEKGNAFTTPMLETLRSIVDEIQESRDIRVVVIRGRGRFFCTGGDITEWGSLTPSEMARHWILGGIDALQRLAALPQPVIAAISGHAIGGGLELAMAADLRIAVKAAQMSVPETTLGMISGWTGVSRLAELIGMSRARHMTLLGTPIDAEQALNWGLITTLAEDSEDMERQLSALVEQLSTNAPIAMALTKGILATLHSELRQHHASAAAHALATEDCQEGVRAFREKRKPVFHNR